MLRKNWIEKSIWIRNEDVLDKKKSAAESKPSLNNDTQGAIINYFETPGTTKLSFKKEGLRPQLIAN